VDLSDLQRHWDAFGNTDPLWSVLTNPEKKYGGWDKREFFRIGREETADVFKHLDENGVHVPRRRALDFGCAVGRVTQALADHFDQVDGVDIAPSMIRLAKRYNRFGRRCHYHVIHGDDLGIFADDTFDLVYSVHVLQHMEPRYAHRYIEEFLRVLAPDGVVVFQITTDPVEGATGPLPDEAFLAEIEVGESSVRLAPGAARMVPLWITNKGSQTWPASGKDGWWMVTVAKRWLDENGERLAIDDGRTHLREDVSPGKSTLVVVEVRAPSEPGSYRVELDLVQEGAAWFSDRGSPTAAIDVTVRKPPLLRWGSYGSPPYEHTMEMHGVPANEVRAWIEAAGGRILYSFPWSVISRWRSTDFERVCFVVSR
jgi:SAM-dependent methyltransferase